jgi:hypothetical protein
MLKKKKGGCKRQKFPYLGIGVLALAITITLSVAGALAYNDSIINNFYGEATLNQGGGTGEVAGLGAINADPRDIYSGFTDVNITGELRFGNEDKLTDGFSQGYKVLTLNATSSVAELNNTGETLWVYDAYMRIQTATTSNGIEYVLGTSTVASVPRDANFTTKPGLASIASSTKNMTTTVVGDTYFKDDFQGVDTRDGTGIRYVVPVLDQEYFTCYASSTTEYKGGATQTAQCVVKFYTLDD